MPVLGSRYLNPATSPPFDPWSLTQYFHESSNGRFTLHGEEVGYVTSLPENSYFVGSALNEAMLIGEAMDSLYAQGSGPINFANYDADVDGYLDHVFVVVRGFNGTTGHGVACGAGSSGGCASGVSYLYLSEQTTTRFGIKVDANRSGSFNQFQVIDPMFDNIEVLAHEIGHDIWTQGGFEQHLPYLSGNGLPGIETNGVPSPLADNNVAYALMLGQGSGDIRGDRGGNASVAERYHANPGAGPALQWVSCPAPVSGQTYTMVDQETGDSCIRLPLGTVATTARSLFLSNVQRVAASSLTSLQPVNPGSAVCSTCISAETGLPTTGLVIEAVGDSTITSQTPAPPYWLRDIVLADNQLTGFANGAVCDLADGVGQTLSEIGTGDFWRPGLDRQLTPWTRPNVYAYTRLGAVPASFITAGLHAIDDIRAGAGTAILFDYHQNYNAQPVAYVREDWWVANEITGLTFNEVRVQSGATLNITATTAITFNGDIVVEGGGTLAISPGATLRFAPGKRTVVHGILNATGATLTAVNSAQGWGGVRFEPSSFGALNTSVVELAATSSGASITINGASPTIYDSIIRTSLYNTTVHGIVITGSASPRILGNTIFGHTGSGIVVSGLSGGAVPTINGNIIRSNNGVGLSFGSGGNGAVVNNQVGISATQRNSAGVTAAYGATPTFHIWNQGSNNQTYGQNRILFNETGGLVASQGAQVFAGSSTHARNNNLYGNAPVGTQWVSDAYGQNGPDAEALTSGIVEARYDWWGRIIPKSGTPDIRVTGLGSQVYWSPALTTNPLGGSARSTGFDASLTVESRGAGADGLGQAGLYEGDAILAALEAARAGRLAEAYDHVREAILRSAGAPVPGVAYALAGQLCGAVPGAEGLLTAEAAVAGSARQADRRAWALRGLTLCHEAAGRGQAALAVAEALARTPMGSEAPDATHAVFGHIMAMGIHLRDGRTTEALAALRAAEALAPDDEGVRVAAAAYVAVTGDLDENVVVPRASSVSVDAATAKASETFALEPAWPNPARGTAVVPFVLGEPATVDLVVFDALGRQVAVLASGHHEAGRHEATLATETLPAGAYVVRASVMLEGGVLQSQTRRLVIVR